MASTKPTYAVNVISTIGTTVEERAITTDAFKAKFDETNASQKAWEIAHCNENDADFALKANNKITHVSDTASRTLALTDRYKWLQGNHASVAINYTVPPSSSVAWEEGDWIIIEQTGAAQVAVVAGSGVTIKPATKLKINGQDTVAALEYKGSNVWSWLGSVKA